MYGFKWFIKIEHKGESNPYRTLCTLVTLCAYAVESFGVTNMVCIIYLHK